MKRFRRVLAACALGSLMTGCGPRGEMAQVSPPPTGLSLDTAQVLAQARQSSETDAPYTVDGGALELTDTSDESQPIPVNGT